MNNASLGNLVFTILVTGRVTIKGSKFVGPVVQYVVNSAL